MSPLNDHEFEMFEAELRRYHPQGVDPLPLPVPRFSATVKWIAAAAIILLFAIVFWFALKPRQRQLAIAREPLTRIRAQAAMARGASIDDLAPLPVKHKQPNQVSALEVLSQE